jgi:hypothetical protein
MMPEIFSSDEDFKTWFDFGEEGKSSDDVPPDAD